jgi:hypothetical protein
MFVSLVISIWYYYVKLKSGGSVVGIETGYELDEREVGVRVPVGSRIFTTSYSPDRLWGSTQPSKQWLPGVHSPGVKQQELPTSAEVKNTRLYTSTPLSIHGVVSNQLRQGQLYL